MRECRLLRREAECWSALARCYDVLCLGLGALVRRYDDNVGVLWLCALVRIPNSNRVLVLSLMGV
jgi:hypothetical protein